MIYPTSGFYLDLNYKASLFSSAIFAELIDSINYQVNQLETKPYHKLSLESEYYLPVNRNFTLFSGLNVGLADKHIIAIDKFYPGGFRYNLRQRQVPFVGISPNTLAVNNLIALKFGVNVKIKSFFYLSGLVNMISYSDSIRGMYNQITLVDGINTLGYGAGLTIKSMFGPLSFFTGWNTKDNKPIYYLNLCLCL
jgi:hypothetical protein